MKGGRDCQQMVDLLIPCNAKLSLLQGEGPVHLVGSHCVDFYGYRDTGAGDDDDEDENTEDEDLKDEVDELSKEKELKPPSKTTPVKDEDGKKRKASEDQSKS